MLCIRFDLFAEEQTARRLFQGNVSSLRLLSLLWLTNICPDFADKNNRSNGCFYLAILQSTNTLSTS